MHLDPVTGIPQDRDMGDWSETGVGRLALLTFACSGLLGCASARPDPSLPEAGAASKTRHPIVVVLAVDGVAPQDVFAGSSPLPHLRALEAEGFALGRQQDFVASGPNYVSLPGYLELLGSNEDGRCTENNCPHPFSPTLLDEIAASSPRELPLSATALQMAVLSSWKTLDVAASQDRRVGLVSAGFEATRNARALRGLPETERLLLAARYTPPAVGGIRPDAVTADIALAYLNEARPLFLFISLGETDEYAHLGRPTDYQSALRFADQVAGEIRSSLHEAEADGHPSLFFVTTDHGRADNFRDHGRQHLESAQAFLVAGGSASAQASVHECFTKKQNSLSAVPAAIRQVLQLPR